jgi:ABC-2 type transport system permease protein
MPAAVVGALVIAGEYGTGTIRNTFAATPCRATVQPHEVQSSLSPFA